MNPKWNGQFSCFDLVAKTVRWRAEVDKIGYDHRNPLHGELIPLLERMERGNA